MIVNTFSYLWSASAIDAMSELIANGYTEFEVPVSSPHCWPLEMPKAVRAGALQRLQDSGARVRSLNAGGYDINLASPAASMRRKSTDHIKDVMELAGDWGVPEVVISPGTRRPMISPSLPQTFGWLHESLGVLLPIAEKAGVRLLFENTPYCFRPTIGELAGVVEEVGNDNLKIVYDVANAAYVGEDPIAALRKHHSVMGLVHISDTGLDVWGHDPIGTGIIDWEGLGEAIKSTYSVDDVVFEVIRDENPLLEVQKGMQELKNRGWDI
jgi:L-ribulose-5-phosphate 3-epimerase